MDMRQMTEEELEGKAEELCSQINLSNTLYGESAIILDENNEIRVLTIDEIMALQEKYDFSKMTPIDIDKI
jgi:hypothetical protein